MSASKDLIAIRDRFKALSADINWITGGEGTECDGEELRKDTYELARTVQQAIDDRKEKQFGVSKDDPELVKFLDGVIGTVEADSYAQHSLWQDYAVEGEKFGAPGRIRYSWVQGTGCGRQCGIIDMSPVMVSLNINIVDGNPILFYYGMSRVVDHEMIRKWLKANLPKTAFRADGYINNTDATNFCNILHSARRAKVVA